MSLGWTASGVNGPIATDPANNALWAMNKGSPQKLDELNADSGTLMQQFSVPLDSQQHFPTPQVSSGWVIIESTDKVFAHQTNGPGTWTSVVLDGLVQARPLVVGGSIVVVATEGDSLYGLNLADGTFAWSTAGNKVNIGTPEPISESDQVSGVSSGCGDINPLGITSNPVLDNGNVYAVGERETGPSSPHTPEHVMVGVNPATGATTVGPVNIDVPAMTVVGTEQQRAGLVAAKNNVYIGFGGLAGDCGNYHGYVVAASESDGHVVGSFEAAKISNAAAVWGTSGPVADSSGNVYATTGNSQPGNTAPDYSDGIVRLAANMSGATTTPADYFQPTTWVSDNANDWDLGSTGPVLLPNGMLFIAGKQNTAFLLNPSSLGGANHMTPVGSLNLGAMAFGQNAAMNNSSVYVALSSGMQQVKIS
jgi:hypothetical protein